MLSHLVETLIGRFKQSLRIILSSSYFEKTLATLSDWFHPRSSSSIRRLQFFWLGCVSILIVSLAYGIVYFLFDSPQGISQDNPKPSRRSFETISQTVDLNEVFRHKMEDDLQNVKEEITALKTLFQEGLKAQQERENKPEQTPLIQELEAKLSSLEQLFEKQKQASSQGSSEPTSGDQEISSVIHKISLNLRDSSSSLKTTQTSIPAGSFAKSILLSGIDASASMTASSDPRPMLLRIIDPGTLPRRFQSDLKDCHCIASAFGDLSSERVYARLEKLSCVDRRTAAIIETQVSGYVAGADGKAGIRGIVVSKDGQFLGRSLLGGIFSGLSNVANPQNRSTQGNPFLPNNTASSPNAEDLFTSGMASGASSALDRLSQYYIDRAEQLQPVIQVAAGQVVDIVFTEGSSILGDQKENHLQSPHQSPIRKENTHETIQQEN